MIQTEELVCRKLHMPWPNVRIPANTRVSIGPKWLADALCARGFFERIAPDIIKQEAAPPIVKEEANPPDGEQASKGEKGR